MKYPLGFLTLIGREARGIIFYHHNYIQNERLKKEIYLLQQKQNSLQEAYFENERLKNLLGFKKISPYKLIASRVIGRSSDNWSSVIIIDKGGYSGINTGFTAVSYLGLLGRVIEASKSSSKIMLINDPNFSVSAVDQRSRQEGLVSGTLGNSLVMKYLPKDADIKVSDVIISSGLTPMYPKGLLIGSVIEVGEEFSGLSRYAIINPAANMFNIEEVLIIVPQ
ncbi:MAG: rod shape-determining protein MreC [Candidatus Omnitrophota bacterium]